MILSSSSKYAINAVLYLAVNSSEEKKIKAAEISKKLSIPAPFLSKILQILSREKIVSSTKGPGGGFFLTQENTAVNLIDIVKTMDGLDNLEDCVLGLKKCSNEKPCPVHFSVKPLKDRFKEELRHNTVASFAEEVKAGKTHLFL